MQNEHVVRFNLQFINHTYNSYM